MKKVDLGKLDHMVVAITCPSCKRMFGLKLRSSVGYLENWKCACGHRESSLVRDKKDGR